jgi:iron complex outermembrane receptor protein
VGTALLFTGILAVSALTTADAQTAPAPAKPPGDAVQIDQVTVTARKREEASQDVPEMITAVSGDSLDQQGLDRIEELNPQFPSSNFQYGNSRQTSLALRGLGNNPANPNLESDVGIYVDNVYLGAPGMLNTNLVDIEQLSLIEGPQGTLFGKNTNAGVLNIVTRSPSFEPSATATATVGTFATTQLSGVMTGPLWGQKLAGRLTASKYWQGGYINDITDDRQLSGHNREGLRGELLYAPSKIFSLRLIGEYDDENSNCCTSVPVHFNALYVLLADYTQADPGPVIDPRYRTSTLDGPISNHADQRVLTADARWQLGDYKLTSITGWRRWNYEPHNDVDQLATPAILDNGQNIHHTQYSEELRLTSPTGPAIDYVVGLFAYYQRQNDDVFTDYGPTADRYLLQLPNSFANTATDLQSDPTTRSLALFAQGTWHISPTWRLTAGLRGTEERKTSTITRVPPTLPSTERPVIPQGLTPYGSGPLSLSGDNLSDLITLDYRPSSGLMLYGAIARGAKSGAINASVPPPDAPASSLYVQPETVTSYELGLKSNLYANLVQFNASVFRATAKNYQSLLIVQNEPSIFTGNLANVGSVRAQGVEWQLTAISPRVGITLSGSYVDSVYKSFPDGPCASERVPLFPPPVSCNMTGYQLYGVPHWILNPGLAFRTHVDRDINFYALSQYSWRSSAFGSPDDSAYGRIPAYGLANFHFGLHDSRDNWDVALWVTNAFNKHYVIGGSGVGIGALYNEFPGMPRVAGVTVKVGF